MFRSLLAIIKFPRQPDDGQYRPKHVVVSITVIKYTSVTKLCLTTYLFLVSTPVVTCLFLFKTRVVRQSALSPINRENVDFYILRR